MLQGRQEQADRSCCVRSRANQNHPEFARQGLARVLCSKHANKFSQSIYNHTNTLYKVFVQLLLRHTYAALCAAADQLLRQRPECAQQVLLTSLDSTFCAMFQS